MFSELPSIGAGSARQQRCSHISTQLAQFNDDIAAFNAGIADLRDRFPGGQPGNAVPRNANQYLGLAKVDWNLNNDIYLPV
jgi:hypothetical protein